MDHSEEDPLCIKEFTKRRDLRLNPDNGKDPSSMNYDAVCEISSSVSEADHDTLKTCKSPGTGEITREMIEY